MKYFLTFPHTQKKFSIRDWLLIGWGERERERRSERGEQTFLPQFIICILYFYSEPVFSSL
jgi:hypothetical protein